MFYLQIPFDQKKVSHSQVRGSLGKFLQNFERFLSLRSPYIPSIIRIPREPHPVCYLVCTFRIFCLNFQMWNPSREWHFSQQYMNFINRFDLFIDSQSAFYVGRRCLSLLKVVRKCCILVVTFNLPFEAKFGYNFNSNVVAH